MVFSPEINTYVRLAMRPIGPVTGRYWSETGVLAFGRAKWGQPAAPVPATSLRRVAAPMRVIQYCRGDPTPAQVRILPGAHRSMETANSGRRFESHRGTTCYGEGEPLLGCVSYLPSASAAIADLRGRRAPDGQPTAGAWGRSRHLVIVGVIRWRLQQLPPWIVLDLLRHRASRCQLVGSSNGGRTTNRRSSCRG
jgi:hypothetical protein